MGSLGRIMVFPDPTALAAAAAERCRDAARKATAARGVFHIALSGGSTPRLLYRRLAADENAADWSRWHVWFGDERCVPRDHPESNCRMARETLLDHVAIPPAQVHPMYAEGDPVAAAAAYSAALEAGLPHENGRPTLDLVLLGMGEDGHTASLFPGCPALDERSGFVSICTAPNGSARLTLTPPMIEAARNVLVLVSGGEKAETLARVLSGRGEDLPIARIRPRGRFDWFVDSATMEGG